MIRFKQYLNEAFKELPYERTPDIGWWLNNDPIIVYHGTHIRNLPYIAEHGITAPDEGYTAGVVSLALEPNTGRGYASMSGMGGESGRGKGGFRDAGARAKSTPFAERVVLVMEFPKDYIIGGNILPINYASSEKKLKNKDLYLAWDKTDQEYYAMTELKHKGDVDQKYIKGYMAKP